MDINNVLEGLKPGEHKHVTCPYQHQHQIEVEGQNAGLLLVCCKVFVAWRAQGLRVCGGCYYFNPRAKGECPFEFDGKALPIAEMRKLVDWQKLIADQDAEVKRQRTQTVEEVTC